MSTEKGIFVGDSTLLARCVEAYRARGHAVERIITSAPAIRRWAEQEGYRISDAKALESETASLTLETGPVGHLFTIGYLKPLSQQVVSLARSAAINFHDGPLPAYAGLNAPQWALLNAEQTHGVTWHLIERQIDAGDIVAERTFTIEAGETALSLNAKCFEAGLQSFADVLDALEQPVLLARKQAGSRRLFRSDDRPEAGALIDPSRHSVADVRRLVEALHTGPYWSPLSHARIALHTGLFEVTSARLPKATDPRPEAGTAGIWLDDTSLVLGASDGPIVLEGLVRLSSGGRPELPASEPEEERQARVCCVDDETARRIGELGRSAAKAEPCWIARLASCAVPALPYPARAAPHRNAAGAGTGSTSEHVIELDAALGEDDWLAALALWLWTLSEARSFCIWHRTPERCFEAQSAHEIFLPGHPVIVTGEPGDAVKGFADRVLREASAAAGTAPIYADLPLRLSRQNAPLSGFPRPMAALRVVEGQIGGAGRQLESPPAWITAGVEPPSVCLRFNRQTGAASLHVEAAAFNADVAQAMASQLQHMAHVLQGLPAAPLIGIPIVPPAEQAALEAATTGPACDIPVETFEQAFSRQAGHTPQSIAVIADEERLTFAQLDAAADRIASALCSIGKDMGGQPARGVRIGVALERSPALLATLLAISRVGASYVPLDRDLPAQRKRFMAADAKLDAVVCEPDERETDLYGTASILIAADALGSPNRPLIATARVQDKDGNEEREAYVMFTSGSTGEPKGVAISNGNIANFFAGMDHVIGRPDGGIWYAVTRTGFDISVLELLWTLSRGMTVVLHGAVRKPASRTALEAAGHADKPDARTSSGFSLFFFAAEHEATERSEARRGDRPAAYRLLIEAARFADRNGFEAVWTPERHYHDFGAPYPNPAITGAAIAAVTERIAIRAGSCVLPRHDPISVAEDWSLVDNLSGGRAGVAMASGWMPEDFVVAPEAFEDRHQRLFDHLETVRTLWSGNAVERQCPDGSLARIRIRPRPVQETLPLWLTAARSPKTFEEAGRRGLNVLTHLLGLTHDELAANIAIYRSARAKAGHTGPGKVSLMLHTFCGDSDETVRDIVRAPMKAYLARSVDLVKAANWSFPTTQRPSEAGRFTDGVEVSAELTAADREALLEHAFERYFTSNALFGTPETIAGKVADLRQLGVDEFACLIDFGVPAEAVLDSLPKLKRAGELSGMIAAEDASEPTPVAPSAPARPAPPVPEQEAAGPAGIAAGIVASGATYFQCTPSMAAMLLADEAGREALSRLEVMLVGGEAIPLETAKQLARLVPGRVYNVYGPTEATVWVTAARLEKDLDAVPLGRPLANNRVRVIDRFGRDCPPLVAGELMILGQSVSTSGYVDRAEANFRAFSNGEVAGPFPQRAYRTGDLARLHPGGRLEFIGRNDHQVKLRGHRIEPGEIEHALRGQPGFRDVIVLAIGEAADGRDRRLEAFMTLDSAEHLDEENLRTQLKAQLPSVMVPTAFHRLERFPLTPNGKIDRDALRRHALSPGSDRAGSPALSSVVDGLPQARQPGTVDPAETSHRYAGMPAPAGSLECLSRLWARVLRRADLTPQTNFFEAGGHSLLAIELHGLIRRELGCEMGLVEIFRFPTLQSLATRIDTLLAAGARAHEARGVAESPSASAAVGSARARKRLSRVRGSA